MTQLDRSNLFSRQSLIWNETDYVKPIYVYGVGFIGSNLIYNLAKTGFTRFIGLDPDTIGEENLLNQMYTPDQVGMSKVEGISKNLESIFSCTNGMFFPIVDKLENYFAQGNTVSNNAIHIVATDNIPSRIAFAKKVLESWDTEKGYDNSIFIFVNTSGQVVYIGVNRGDKEFFVNMITTLEALTPDDISEGLCGEKSSFYLGSLVSGYVISELRKIIKSSDPYIRECLYRIEDNTFLYQFTWFQTNKE